MREKEKGGSRIGGVGRQRATTYDNSFILYIYIYIHI